MTDNELSALVAEKVMGWELSDRGFYVKGINKPESYDTPNNWKPASDIAPAWQVMEKLTSLGFLVTIISPPPGYQTWDVRGWKPEINSDRFIAHSDTAPRAICLAALEAIKVNV